jgi:hypothetical protein
MASIALALDAIKRQLTQAVSENTILEAFRDQKVRWRKRKLNPVLTIQLLILQLLAQVAFSGLRHVSGIDVSPQAICQARQRIPLQLMLGLVESFCKKCIKDFKPVSDFFGHRVVLADGMAFCTPDTPELEDRFGKAKNHKGTSPGYPQAKLLALLDASTGLIYKVIALPWARQERTCLTRLFKALVKGDLLLGDRGLGGFCQLAMLLEEGLHCALRLARWQVVFGRGKANHKQCRKLGKNDKLVTWHKGDRRPSWMSRKRFNQLPQTLTLRQISFRVCRRGHRTRWGWMITTLLDPVKYPADEIASLYAKRWQVEVCFRDLKQTLGMKQLRSRSVKGIRKEIAGFVILYNLIRGIMAQAAVRQKTDPDRISFKDVMQWLLFGAAGRPTFRTNRRRKRPCQPRMIKQGRRRFPSLKTNRKQLQQPAYEVRL